MKWLLSAVLILLGSVAMAQGVTTAELSGRVTDVNGDLLPGAVIHAIHEPTGTQYNTVTRADGNYRILNVRVGGPYTISASMTGFQTSVVNDVFLKLGENRRINFELKLESVEEELPQ